MTRLLFSGGASVGSKTRLLRNSIGTQFLIVSSVFQISTCKVFRLEPETGENLHLIYLIDYEETTRQTDDSISGVVVF